MTDSLADFDAAVAALAADVADDYRTRRARGEDPSPDEYVARHPEAAEAIRGVLAALRLAASSVARPPGPPPADPAPPTGRLGDFRIIREVGRGGMGVVYEAEQISLGRRVALKVLPFAALSDPRLLQRFKNEARAAAALDHPHVVKVHAVGEDRAVHFIAMQFIDGRPLSDLIRAVHGPDPTGPTDRTVTLVPDRDPFETSPSTAPAARLSTLPGGAAAGFFRRAAEMGVQAAEALEHAHALGVVHRDVKPANLLVDGHGDVWVSDFGLAKVAAADLGVTATGDVFGTLRYMSPEQALAKHDLVDHRTDIYSLGATLYELLAGRPAVDGKDKADVLRRITDADPAPLRRWNRAVPADLETVVLKCLRKEPNERYASAKELADDLRRFLAGEPVRAKPIGPVGRGTRWVARHPIPVLLVGLTALATLAAVALGVRSHYRAEAHHAAIQAAADRDERKAAELQAARAAAERQEFFAGLERVRERRADPSPGWSRANLTALRELSRMGPAGDALPDLRSEAAAALSALDLISAGVVGPGFPVCGLDYSPDGHWLAAGRWGGLTVRLYDPATGQKVRDLSITPDARARGWPGRARMPDRVLAVKFSPDGRRLVAGTGSGLVACWDMRDLDAAPRIWGAHTEPSDPEQNKVFTLVFAADGRTFLSGTRTAIRGWFPDGRPAGPQIDGYRLPYSLPPVGGRTPVAREGHGDLQILDLETGQVVPGTRHTGAVPFAVGAGGRLMAFAPVGWAAVPRLQAVEPGAAARPLNTGTGAPVHLRNLEYMAFDPAGGLLVTVEEQVRRVKLWDVAAAQLAAAEGTPGDATRAAFTPDGRRLAVAGRHGVALFDLPNRVLDTLGPTAEENIGAVAAARDHSVVWIVGGERGLPVRVYRWEAAAAVPGLREILALPSPAAAVGVATCSPDGRVAFYAHTDGRRAHLCTTDGRTWDVGDLVDAALGPDGRVWFADAHVLRVAAPPNWVDREAWRNDPVAVDEGMAPRTLCVGHSWVFVGRRDGRLIRIPPDGGTAVGWPLLKMPVAGLALSPDESRLLVGGEGGEVRLVDPATGAVVEIPDAHRADVPAVAFGRHFFVTGSADRRVRLWTPDGQPIATLRMQGPVRKVLLSDDERSLLVLVEGERAVRRWRLDVLFEEWRALDVGADLPPV